MNLNISAWAIRNPTPAILFFILLTIAGLLGFQSMKVQDLPDLELPTVTVTASLPGASPSQLETDVARKLENALATVQGVRHIYSTLTEGEVSLRIEFRLERPIQQALDDVRDAVARTRADLPAALRDPVIKKEELSGTPILTYSISSSRLDNEALSWFVDNDISKSLLAVKGVGAVTRVGGVSREVRVELDPNHLLAFNTTAADISRQLRQTQQEDTGGRSSLGGMEQSIRTMATVASAEDIASMHIALSDGRSIRLDQIARVSDTISEPRSAAYLNGEAVVGFEIVRALGYGELEVAQGVRAALQQLKQQKPDIQLTEVFNLIDPVTENYDGSMQLLYEGALLAVIVVFLFLRDWRATFIAATALPLSVIPTFAVMHLMGFSLNTVTLLSLSLVIGVLVDDAIVEIENIERHLLMGKRPFQAAIEAADEIGLAVIATTLTLVAVFLPTAFMSGVVGKFFVQFGWTASVAVLFSLLVARLLTPMMAAYLLKTPTQQVKPEPGWVRYYLHLMHWCLAHRHLTATSALVFFAVGLYLASQLPDGFMPADDNQQTQVTLTLQPGTRLQETTALAEQARSIIAKHKQVKQVYTAIGSGSSGEEEETASSVSGVSTAVLTLTLTHRSERTGVHKQQIERELRQMLSLLPGARIKVGMGDAENYSLVLAGEDSRLLEQHALLVQRELRSIPGLGAVISSASLVRPELIIKPDFTKAADLGVTSFDIADTLRIATSGDYEQDLAKLNLNQRQVPITVRLNDEARADIEALKRLPIPGARGPVALENVATLELSSGPSQISRFNRMRNISFDVELNSQALGDVEEAILALPSIKNMPAGISQNALGDAEMMGELATGFAIAMLTGVLCIYMVLVLLLKDVFQPLTILTALLLSVPGAFLALFITGSTLSLPAMIGLIMLMGIATKNSILLIDYIILAQSNYQLSQREAIVDACRKRVRPIVMTTLAMGAGMLPIALGIGGDPSFRSPMAIVVVGGLITSTFLSVLVVPVLYSYVDDGVSGLKRLVWRNQESIRATTRNQPL
jgi:multidrug efflux pump subunit AcrB